MPTENSVLRDFKAKKKKNQFSVIKERKDTMRLAFSSPTSVYFFNPLPSNIF